MKLSPRRQLPLIRLCYFLPLLSAVILLILALVPRFFYLSDGKALPDMTLFSLLDNTYHNCIGFFRPTAQANASPSAFYFALIMIIFWALSWLCIVFFTLFALFTAFLGVMVWTPDSMPGKFLNNAKRFYRMLVPNRAFFAVMSLLPLLPACFPYLMQLFYHTVLKESAKVYYYGLPDPVWALLLGICCCLSFFLTLSGQKELHMDLFRLYKTE